LVRGEPAPVQFAGDYEIIEAGGFDTIASTPKAIAF
jgi:hypothetical protein